MVALAVPTSSGQKATLRPAEPAAGTSRPAGKVRSPSLSATAAMLTSCFRGLSRVMVWMADCLTGLVMVMASGVIGRPTWWQFSRL